MKLSVGSRGWLWTGLLLLLLAASCTVIAEDPPATVTPVNPVTSKANSSLVNATTPSPKEPATAKSNGTAEPVPVVPTSNHTVTSPKPATKPAPTSHLTTPKTHTPAKTNTSTTAVTTKETVTTKTTNATATSSSPVTSSKSAALQQKSGFDLGSFIGGIVLTIGLLAAVYFGCRFYNSKRGVRYRTIDEHEAII